MALKYDPNVLQQALAAASGFGATPLENKALVEAGLVESGLTHLTGGDRDSTGFLQQRPSQGWGPVGESVSKDTLQFLRAARKLRKGGFKGSAGELAQAVQRSAFPARYDQRAQDAVRLLQGAGSSSPRPGAVAASADGAPADSQGLGAAVATLLAAGQKPQIASAGIAAPAFSARAAMPQGAQLPQGGGGPQPQGPNVDSLLALVAGQQGQAPAQDSPDAAGANTGPASSSAFGKSHSPLLELIHKGDKPYAVKNGKVVDPSVYSDVWDGHADHVHVAAGPKTVVQIGSLAQKLGLHVGENPHFGGVNPVHAKNSYHYKGEAIDVSGDPRKMNQFAAQVERLYGLGG